MQRERGRRIKLQRVFKSLDILRRGDMISDIDRTEKLRSEVVVDISAKTARIEAVPIGAWVAGDVECGVDGRGKRTEIYGRASRGVMSIMI